VTVSLIATDASGNSTLCAFGYQIGIFSCLPLGGVIYVNDNATGSNNGDSWQNAFTDLQNALAIAVPGNQIWVAEGTYYPGSLPTSTFVLVPGVALYGGFPDNLTCPDLTFRDWTAYPTILSGDIGVPGDVTDNCARVLQASNVGSNVTVDGFRVTAGNAPQAGAGVGILASNGPSGPNFENCTFENHQAGAKGAAVYVLATGSGQANPSFFNCEFLNNSSVSDGGAISSIGQSGGTVNLTLSGVRFENNQSQRGGALSVNTLTNGSAVLNLAETQFTTNQALLNGGAIWLNARSGSSLQYVVENCQFTGNTAQNGAVMFNQTLAGNMSGTVGRSQFNANISQNYGTVTIFAEKGLQVNALTTENCLFENNKSGRGGGLAFVATSGGRTSAQILRTRLVSNSGMGGGAYFLAQGSSAQSSGSIVNTIFSRNTSFNKGGGLATQAVNGGATNVQVAYSNFHANLSGYGGAVANFVQGTATSNLQLGQSLFWDNLTLFQGAKNFLSDGVGASTSLQSSIVEQGLCANNFSGTGTFTCTGLSAQNPAWTDPANGDFSLLANSPALDLSASGPALDIDGNPRPVGAGFDWGAYERQSPRPAARLSEAAKELNATVVPNPNSGSFQLVFDQPFTGILQVFDGRGSLITSQKSEASREVSMQLTDLPAGAYAIRAVTAEAVLTLRIIVQKP
jgi:hypothetical protein